MFFFVQGNYDQYIQTRMELEENQMKKYRWEQDQMQHMKVNNRASSQLTSFTDAAPLAACRELAMDYNTLPKLLYIFEHQT